MQTTMMPLASDLPAFGAALQSLDDVPIILYRGLEHAAYKTSVFRDSESPRSKLDGGLSASLFRFHGIKYLNGEGLEAHPDGCHWTFNNIPFLGISFYYKQNHVRVLKGPKGMLPGCGKSERKKRFFNQVQTSYLVGNVPARTSANIIVLWDFDTSYALAQLWLALPAVGAARAEDVRAFWCEPIPHPAVTAVPATPSVTLATNALDSLVRPKVDKIEEDKKNVR